LSGWDSIFQPDEGKGKTYNEMTSEFKDECSHRCKALKKLIGMKIVKIIEFLKNYEN
jgi:inosine/xanthosine triphosphate pyrophosphatase family protein